MSSVVTGDAARVWRTCAVRRVSARKTGSKQPQARVYTRWEPATGAGPASCQRTEEVGEMSRSGSGRASVATGQRGRVAGGGVSRENPPRARYACVSYDTLWHCPEIPRAPGRGEACRDLCHRFPDCGTRSHQGGLAGNVFLRSPFDSVIQGSSCAGEVCKFTGSKIEFPPGGSVRGGGACTGTDLEPVQGAVCAGNVRTIFLVRQILRTGGRGRGGCARELTTPMCVQCAGVPGSSRVYPEYHLPQRVCD